MPSTDAYAATECNAMMYRWFMFGLILVALGVLTVSRFVHPWDDEDEQIYGGAI